MHFCSMQKIICNLDKKKLHTADNFLHQAKIHPPYFAWQIKRALVALKEDEDQLCNSEIITNACFCSAPLPFSITTQAPHGVKYKRQILAPNTNATETPTSTLGAR